MAGYAAALHDLAELYAEGTGVEKNGAEALRLFLQGAERGYIPGFSEAGQLYWDGTVVKRDRAQALRWFERGAAAGDPASHETLGEIYETGNSVPNDLAKALLHYAIATRLFTAFGDETDAANDRARRGSLARALPPATAVRIAYEAMDWYPAKP